METIFFIFFFNAYKLQPTLISSKNILIIVNQNFVIDTTTIIL